MKILEIISFSDIAKNLPSLILTLSRTYNPSKFWAVQDDSVNSLLISMVKTVKG